jgi:Pentapeptide repeats (8 copies)
MPIANSGGNNEEVTRPCAPRCSAVHFQGVDFMTRQKFGLEAAAFLLAEYKTGKRQFTDRRKTDRVEEKPAAPDLSGMDLRNVRLKWIVLSGAKLFRANLSGACLGRAELSQTNFQEADLTNTDLSYANLCRADLTDANLKCANLRNAILIDANLTGADLRGIQFDGADFSGAIIKDAKLPPGLLANLTPTLQLNIDSTIQNPIPEVTIEMLSAMG